MTPLDQKRGCHFAHMCAIMPELVTRLSWSRAQIEVHRENLLRQMLHHAQAHSPWHARRLRGHDLAKVPLSALPTMTKNDLMENWDEIATPNGANRSDAERALRDMTNQFYIWGDHVLFASGGTGGRPGLFLYDWDGLALNWAGMGRGMRHYIDSLPLPGGPPPQNWQMVSLGAEASAHGSFVTGRIFSNPANPTRGFSGWRSVDDLIPKLNDAQPQLIAGYPNLVPGLAAAAVAGRLTIQPKLLYLGGEHLSDGARQLAREAWPDADILTCWGTSEGGGTFPCPLGDGFHVSEDLVIIEPVDAHGAPVAPGQKSAGIYFTSLYNKALPVIRYYIDDVFEMADAPCACGSAFRKVRQVDGRAFEKFHYGAVSVHPVTLQLAVLEQPQILDYQIRQTARGVHLVYSSNGPIDEARAALKLQHQLIDHNIRDPRITVERVSQVGRTAAGKLKRFVPLAS
jgi:phenylacetate-coenzyme A ligase PaaK-like adenylate-forming protein